MRVESAHRNGDSEVNGHMTANWAGALINFLLLAFFGLAVLGIGTGVYAAGALKKAEDRCKEKASYES